MRTSRAGRADQERRVQGCAIGEGEDQRIVGVDLDVCHAEASGSDGIDLGFQLGYPTRQFQQVLLERHALHENTFRGEVVTEHAQQAHQIGRADGTVLVRVRIIWRVNLNRALGEQRSGAQQQPHGYT